MPDEQLSLNFRIKWKNLMGEHRSYQWGDSKKTDADPNWQKRNVVYRWVRNSDEQVAIIGETDRPLTQRVNNYISAKPDSQAGMTNKKVYEEQQNLSRKGDFLYLEFTDEVPGYNLSDQRERRLAEKLLIGYSKPYLQ